jgi:hypothetical protein
MSSIANLIAFDGAATPVSHTFLPINILDSGSETVALYRESLASVPVYGQPTVKMSLGKRSKNGVYRTLVQVDVPVMEAILNQNAAGYTAAPKVAHTVSDRFEQFAHERSDITVRRLERQLLVNIAGGIAMTVTPVTTGPAPELIDQLITPT